MKSKILAVVLILIVMAVIPIITIQNGFFFFANNSGDTKDTATENQTQAHAEEKDDDNTEILRGLLYAKYSDDVTDEALRAMAVLFQTDLKADKDCFDLEDKSTYFSEEELKNEHKNSYKEIKERVTSITESVKNIYIFCNDEISYVPYAQCSSGYTFADENYPGLLSVASPWDRLSKNYSNDNKCAGVSLDGIVFLTEKKNDYKTALMWYLPNYEIRECKT
ncbi:MAG: hypothetical protein ACI4W1_00445 [Ruminococcus sp.]